MHLGRWLTEALVSVVLAAGCAANSSPRAPSDGVPAAHMAPSTLEGQDRIRPNCEKEWPDDWSAIALCVRTGTEGFQEVKRFVESHHVRLGDGTPEAKIVDKCLRDWPDNHGQPSWPAIALCVRQQWAGYKELNP